MTGSSWVDIEAILDHEVSDTTLRARRDEWIAAGVFEQLIEADRRRETTASSKEEVLAKAGDLVAPPGLGRTRGLVPGSGCSQGARLAATSTPSTSQRG